MPVSVDGELVLQSGTDGQHVKSATGTGFVYATSGVMSVVQRGAALPFLWPEDAALVSAQAVTANTAYYYRFRVTEPTAVANVILPFGAGAGNVKTGFFTSPNAEAAVGSLELDPVANGVTGITAIVPSSAQTIALPGTINLAVLTDYFWGIAIDSGTPTPFRIGGNAIPMGIHNRFVQLASQYANFGVITTGFVASSNKFFFSTS